MSTANVEAYGMETHETAAISEVHDVSRGQVD